jgi:hypothetical protein
MMHDIGAFTCRNAITLKVRNVGRKRCGTEGAAAMADHTRLRDDPAMTHIGPAAAGRGAASAEY